MKLTNRQIAALNIALGELDGERQPDGTLKPYKLSAKARYAIARTLVAIKPYVEAFEKARLGAVAPFSGGKAGVAQHDPKYQEAQAAVDVLLAIEVEVDPHRLKLDELNLDANAIPPSVLAALDPVIDAG